jgi:hypothetical protein
LTVLMAVWLLRAQFSADSRGASIEECGSNQGIDGRANVRHPLVSSFRDHERFCASYRRTNGLKS